MWCERVRGFGLFSHFFLFSFLTSFCRSIQGIFENEGTKIIQFPARRRYSSLPLSSPLLSSPLLSCMHKIQDMGYSHSLSLTSLSLSLAGTHNLSLGVICNCSRYHGSTAPLNNTNSRYLAFTHRLSSSSRGLHFQAPILPSNLQRLQDTSLQTWSNHASIQKESCAVWTRQASPWI
jgi:hypothetical protein